MEYHALEDEAKVFGPEWRVPLLAIFFIKIACSVWKMSLKPKSLHSKRAVLTVLYRMDDWSERRRVY